MLAGKCKDFVFLRLPVTSGGRFYLLANKRSVMLNFFSSNGFDVKMQKKVIEEVIQSVSTLSLWLTVALVAIFLAVGLIVWFKFRDKFRTFVTATLSVAVGVALSLLAVFLYLQISRMVCAGDIDVYFWLMVGLAGTLVISIVTCTLVKLFKPNAFKYTAIGAITLCVAYAIVLLCIFPTKEDHAPIDGSNPLYISLAVILVLIIALTAILCDLKSKSTNNTKALTYAGISIAIAYVLSYIKIFDGPQGSSVTLFSMLPIMLYSYMFGTKKGVIAGLVYGVLQCLQDSQIYEPLQVMLDYPIAFSALGLAGAFKDRKFLKGKKPIEFILGIVLAGVLRYTASVLSGYFVFYSFASWTDKPLLYSLVYNTGILIDAALDVAMGAILFASKSLMLFVDRVNPVTQLDGDAQDQTETDEAKSDEING